MDPRVFKIANFFAFNLLFFALYLNFVHRDKNVQEAMNTVHIPVATRTATNGNTEQLAAKEQATKNAASEKESTKALKLSFN
jgi:hypothetical protein